MENNDLDPIEKMMIARMSDFFVNNMNYDLYHNPDDWYKQVKFWNNIARMVGAEQYLDSSKLDNGNFNYDPSRAIFDLLKSIKINDASRFPDLLGFIIQKLQFTGTEGAEKISTLNRYLSVFNLTLDSNAILRTSGTSNERESDRRLVFDFLNQYHAEKEAFVGALERFAEGGSDSFRQSMTSCRNLIENLLMKISEVYYPEISSSPN